MGNPDQSPRDRGHGRTATTPLDPITVSRATDEAFRRLIHEISGLVDGSLRYVQMAQRDLATHTDTLADSLGLAYLDSATDALTRLATLVHDSAGSLSRYSSIHVGRRLSSDRTMREIIEHAIAVVRPLAEERGVALDASIDTSVDASAALPLYPVLVNALRNAIEACAGGDHVSLLARVDDPRMLLVRIVDTGRGLPEQHARVFDAGFTTKGEGSGLGLAIAHDIVHEIGGEIALAANPDARGCALSVRVPLPPEGRHR